MAIRGRQEQPVPELAWRRDGHAHERRILLRPEDLAGLGVEAVDRFAVPDDELARAAGLADHGGTVARFAGAQRPPDLLARVLVEGNDGRAFAAHHADKLLAVKKGVRREAPAGRRDLVVL